MALKAPHADVDLVEVKAKLLLRKPCLEYAEQFAKSKNMSLDQALALGLNQVLVPARAKKEKS